jgi:hypothetical protein
MEDRCPKCDRKIWHCECEKPGPECKPFDKNQFINREHNKKFPEGKKRDEE